jgi:hypothetical protein
MFKVEESFKIRVELRSSTLLPEIGFTLIFIIQ